MLAFALALQLLAAGQTKLEDPAQEPAASPPAAATSAPVAAAQEAPKPAPDQPAPKDEAPRRARDAAAGGRAAQGPTQISLLSAETLHGGSAVLGWVGWPAIGAMWGQGISEGNDAGVLFQYDWAGTEMLIGGWYRRALGRAGPFLLAGRLGLNWYADHEGTWIYSDNEANHGFQIAPSLLLSTRGAGGIFSISGDLPMTITLRGDGGFLFAPRVTGAYEASLYDQLTLGLRAGLGYRAGAGSAPMRDGRADLEIVVLVGYRLF
jgi:hypothetical protein